LSLRRRLVTKISLKYFRSPIAFRDLWFEERLSHNDEQLPFDN
jgi:hypothetical protein